MIGWWQRFMRSIRKPSVDTLRAKERLHKAQRDDERVARVVDAQREIARENHFGEMIAQLFEGHKKS